MNIQKLVILGILKEGPKNGYEIKKIIKKDLGVFTSLENRSIYYPLKMMEQSGLIKKKTAGGQSKLLRYIYSITAAGNKKFLELAMQALLSEKRPFIDIDVPLYFLPFLEKREVIARLRLRKRFLEKVRSWLAENLQENPEFKPHQRLLLKHHLNLLRAEDSFVADIIDIVRKY